MAIPVPPQSVQVPVAPPPIAAPGGGAMSFVDAGNQRGGGTSALGKREMSRLVTCLALMIAVIVAQIAFLVMIRGNTSSTAKTLSRMNDLQLPALTPSLHAAHDQHGHGELAAPALENMNDLVVQDLEVSEDALEDALEDIARQTPQDRPTPLRKLLEAKGKTAAEYEYYFPDLDGQTPDTDGQYVETMDGVMSLWTLTAASYWGEVYKLAFLGLDFAALQQEHGIQIGVAAINANGDEAQMQAADPPPCLMMFKYDEEWDALLWLCHDLSYRVEGETFRQLWERKRAEKNAKLERRAASKRGQVAQTTPEIPTTTPEIPDTTLPDNTSMPGDDEGGDDYWDDLIGYLDILGVKTPADCDDYMCTPVMIYTDATLLASVGFLIVEPPGGMTEIKPTSIKAHEKNLDFTVDYGDSEQLIRYCLYQLPEEPIKGRQADTRAGFFDLPFTVLHTDGTEEPFNIINRQRFPNIYTGKNEIHYYVDPSIPEPFWEATRRGIQMWQVAFDELAEHYPNDPPKIIGHVASDSDWPEDYDVSDIRFNTISWVTAGFSGFAIGQSIWDPRSGEVLKANIAFSLGWLEYYVGVNIIFGAYRASPALQQDHRFASAVQSWQRREREVKMAHKQDNRTMVDEKRRQESVELAAKVKSHQMQAKAKKRATLKNPNADEPKQDLRELGAAVWHAKVRPTDDEALWFLQEAISDVTVHEVGHTLGLRHNFRGNYGSTFEQAQKASYTNEHGLSSSVMDYLSLNFISDATREELRQKWSSEGINEDPADAHIWATTVGAYDRWVIKYGYGVFDDESDASCPDGWCVMGDELRAHATQSDTNEALTFATDETADFIDPYTWRFDLTSEPVRFLREQMKLIKEALENLFDRLLVEDGRWNEVTSVGVRLLGAAERHANEMIKYIGGIRARRVFGDECLVDYVPTNCPKQGNDPVSVQDQSAALEGILDFIKSADTWIPEWFPKQAISDIDYYDSEPGLISWNLIGMKNNLLDMLLAPWRLELLLLSSEFGDFTTSIESWFFGQLSHDLLGMPKQGDIEDSQAPQIRAALKKKEINAQQVRYISDMYMALQTTPSELISAYIRAELYRIQDAMAVLETHFMETDGIEDEEYAFLMALNYQLG